MLLLFIVLKLYICHLLYEQGDSVGAYIIISVLYDEQAQPLNATVKLQVGWPNFLSMKKSRYYIQDSHENFAT